MNNKAIIFIFILAKTLSGFSQENQITEVRDITKLTILNPGVSYEKAIAKFQSLYIQGFMNTSFYVTYSSSLGSDADIYFDPAVTLQYRYYYNAVRRQAKGKRTEMNSMNYIGAITETNFSQRRISISHYDQDKLRPINVIGCVWGMQRNYRSRFSLDLQLGVGFLFTKATIPDVTGQPVSETVSLFKGIVQLNLGFWLNKR